jgi:hypothetical protein
VFILLVVIVIAIGALVWAARNEPAYVQVPLYFGTVLAGAGASLLLLGLFGQSELRGSDGQDVASVGPPGELRVGSGQHGTPIPIHPPRLKITISAQWSSGMKLGESGFVRAVLAQKIVQESSSVQVPTSTVGAGLTSSPVPVGTPGVRLSKAFGPRYLASASAQMSAANFDITPSTTDWEPLDQSSIKWGWSIAPRTSGRQAVFLQLMGQWKPRQNAGSAGLQPVYRQLWQSGPIYISVGQDVWTWGQFNGSIIVGGAVASGLTGLLTGLVAFVINRYQTSK